MYVNMSKISIIQNFWISTIIKDTSAFLTVLSDHIKNIIREEYPSLIK